MKLYKKLVQNRQRWFPFLLTLFFKRVEIDLLFQLIISLISKMVTNNQLEILIISFVMINGFVKLLICIACIRKCKRERQLLREERQREQLEEPIEEHTTHQFIEITMDNEPEQIEMV